MRSLEVGQTNTNSVSRGGNCIQILRSHEYLDITNSADGTLRKEASSQLPQ